MRAYLGLGANIGDTRSTLEAVPAALSSRSVTVTAASRIFRTDPVGDGSQPGPQPDYLNQVLEVSTVLPARELLDACRSIEFAFGRDRSSGVRNAPRTLDIDLLFIEGFEVNERDLVVPHPRMHERAFVLVPLAELAPELQIGSHGTVTRLLMSLGSTTGVSVAS